MPRAVSSSRESLPGCHVGDWLRATTEMIDLRKKALVLVCAVGNAVRHKSAMMLSSPVARPALPPLTFQDARNRDDSLHMYVDKDPSDAAIPVRFEKDFFEQLFPEQSPDQRLQAMLIFLAIAGCSALMWALALLFVEFRKTPQPAGFVLLYPGEHEQESLPAHHLGFLPFLVVAHFVTLVAIAYWGSDDARCLSGFPWFAHYSYGLLQLGLRLYEARLVKQCAFGTHASRPHFGPASTRGEQAH